FTSNYPTIQKSGSGQIRSSGDVGSMSGLPESEQGRAIYGRYGDARLTAACRADISLRRMRSLADIFDAWPDPSDPPEADEDWQLLEQLASAVTALAERLKHEPGLSRAAAQLFVKTETNVPGIHFRSLIWPQARLLAGLPAQKRGRRQRPQ